MDPCPPTPEDLWRLLSGTHADPHAILGAHPDREGTVVRALRPDADAVDVMLPDGSRISLARVHPDGVYSARLPMRLPAYRLVVRADGRERIVEDGYQCPPTVGELDLNLLTTGGHRRLWDILGARRTRARAGQAEVDGVAFAVWAPSARGVRLRGDFNDWNGRSHPLRLLGASGVWEVFVPGVAEGCRYRYDILGPDGRWREKADPLARAATLPPTVTSVVFTSDYAWGDQTWLAERARSDWRRAPISVYEVHLGSWRPGLDYRELAHQLASYVDGLGFTHVQLLPVTEHPFGGSWGYQVGSYFAPTSRFGDPDGFRYFVDHLHQAGIGVLCDFVPAHFPRDDWALGRFDGGPLYEHADPRRGEHPDWGTYIFDYGRAQVRDFLVSAALYWLREFHVDGLRVDAVSSMLYLDYSRPDGEWSPNEYGGRENLEAVRFVRELTGAIHQACPGALVIAEESTAWPGVTADTDDEDGSAGGLGFDLKWNLGWMHDTLDYLGADPLYRAGRHSQLTFSLDYAWSERFLLPLSHDEVTHGKGSIWTRMPGTPERRAAGVRALLAYMWAHPGKQLVFMGGEFGQPDEWDADGSLAWDLVGGGTEPHHPGQEEQAEVGEIPWHQGIQLLVRRMNRLYRELPALHALDFRSEGFEWIVADDAPNNVLAFVRRAGGGPEDGAGEGAVAVCVANFAGIAHRGYRIGMPSTGVWSVVLNSGDTRFGRPGGSTDTWPEQCRAQAVPSHGRPASVVLDLPALSVLWLVPMR